MPASTPSKGSGAKPREEADALGFEEALERLEGVVAELESGDLELEAALEAFEQGVALARRCAGRLDEAEQRIDALVEEGERWVRRPFEEVDAGDDEPD